MVSLSILPTYTQMNPPLGMSWSVRTPHPRWAVLKSWSLSLRGCCTTRFRQWLLHLHLKINNEWMCERGSTVYCIFCVSLPLMQNFYQQQHTYILHESGKQTICAFLSLNLPRIAFIYATLDLFIESSKLITSVVVHGLVQDGGILNC